METKRGVKRFVVCRKRVMRSFFYYILIYFFFFKINPIFGGGPN